VFSALDLTRLYEALYALGRSLSSHYGGTLAREPALCRGKMKRLSP
jgi:hypothetical protein